jgi:hypothetical protein
LAIELDVHFMNMVPTCLVRRLAKRRELGNFTPTAVALGFGAMEDPFGSEIRNATPNSKLVDRSVLDLGGDLLV